MRTRTEIFDEATRKRAAPEPANGVDPAKRQRISIAPAPAPIKLVIPPLAPGQHSVADLFTITDDKALKAFDVGQLPEELVVKIGVILLSRIDHNLFNQTIDASSLQTIQYHMLTSSTGYSWKTYKFQSTSRAAPSSSSGVQSCR